MEPEWRKKNLICSLTSDGAVDVSEQPMPAMRDDLIRLFDRDELAKYLTEAELPPVPAVSAEEPSA
jgi:succinate dehydrogenase / fumarate reductase flavoprotein subunit